ncbi:uncharacterized protein LY89DRAFT_733882 [Mollisia scopiformis]|uniref:2EXR domain-containing protein n=1 Tax=Mollisia scopiformis TaxID=149040 RepID=A0A194X9N9_MOLSC|nr:uncharacterized protein LY89DRAFT_733882 [Mollisia scopiformis]KUJ16878.1 hypothetical protein LY89DRAFT_733882 [Mollisia scopiformis]
MNFSRLSIRWLDPSEDVRPTNLNAPRDSPSPIRLPQLLKTLHHIKTDLKQPPNFPLFPQLPVELRDLIWKHAAFEPRVIYIRHARVRDNCTDVSLFHRGHQKYQDQPIVPILLQVNRQSREEGLRHYTKCFEKVVDPRDWAFFVSVEDHPKHAKLVYINFKVDKFLFVYGIDVQANTYQYNLGAPDGLPLENFNFQPDLMQHCRHLVLTAEHGVIQDFERVKKLMALKSLDEVTIQVYESDKYRNAKQGTVDYDLLRAKMMVILRDIIEAERQGLRVSFSWVSRQEILCNQHLLGLDPHYYVDPQWSLGNRYEEQE